MVDGKIVLYASHISIEVVKSDVPDLENSRTRILDDISFKLHEGESMGIIGESGSGKTALLDILLSLIKPTSGELFVDVTKEAGEELDEINRRIEKINELFIEKYGYNPDEEEIEGNDELDLLTERYEELCKGLSVFRMGSKDIIKNRGYIQPVFQDVYSTLDPKKVVMDSLSEPLKYIQHLDREEIGYRLQNLMTEIGIDEKLLSKYPVHLSESEMQKVAIMRALSVNPRIVVMDDPTAYLDVTMKIKLFNLINQRRLESGTSFLIASSNLSFISSFTQTVAVLCRGRIVEIGPSMEIFSNSFHPYTKALISSIPSSDPSIKIEGIALRKQEPDYEQIPKGCVFHTRCPNVMSNCGWSAEDIESGIREMIDEYRLDDPASIPEIENIISDEGENLIEISFRDEENYDQNLVRRKIEELIEIRKQKPDGIRFGAIDFIEFEAENNNLVLQLVKPAVPKMIEVSEGHHVSCYMYDVKEEEKESQN